MKPFGYVAAPDPAAAIAIVTEHSGAAFLGGGTNLVDLMRLGITTPDLLVDVTGLLPGRIERTPGGTLRIGAGVRNSDLTADPRVRAEFPVLAQAVLAGGIRPAEKHGHRRRQPAAAHPLPVLPGRDQALQQAGAGLGLPGTGRRPPQPGHPGRIAALRGHPSLRHGGGAGGA